MLILGGVISRPGFDSGIVRFLLSAGLAVFCLVAAGGVLLEGKLLKYPDESAKWWILAIESAATVSIIVALAALLARVFPRAKSDDSEVLERRT